MGTTHLPKGFLKDIRITKNKTIIKISDNERLVFFCYKGLFNISRFVMDINSSTIPIETSSETNIRPAHAKSLNS
jgi:hypothetical protein